MILSLLVLLQAAMAAPQPLTVAPQFRSCTKTSECEAVPLRCGCCQYGAVSRIYVTDYLDSTRETGCVDQPCQCQPLKLVPRCVKSRCELVNPNAAKKSMPKAKLKKRKKPARKKKKPVLPKTVPAGNG